MLKVRFALIMLITTLTSSGWAQDVIKKKLDLDDMTIKGELHSDDRMLILSRQKNELKNYIKFRTNYRQEIIQELPEPKTEIFEKPNN